MNINGDEYAGTVAAVPGMNTAERLVTSAVLTDTVVVCFRRRVLFSQGLVMVNMTKAIAL